MFNPMSLAGKRILVTGASSGIGEACVRYIAELGASVVLVARRKEKLESVLKELPDPEKHLALACDLSDLGQIEFLVQSVVQVAGRLDGAVHAAGIGPATPLSLLAVDQMREVFNINYFSFVELVKQCSKLKVRGPNCSIVAISSISALAGWGGVTTYCGSKGAVSSSVRAMAVELAPKGIRVNAVCPSSIRTELYDSKAAALNDEESMKRIAAKQPLGLGLPHQVASVVAFLLSDASSFVTGVNLPVDGGYLAQ